MHDQQCVILPDLLSSGLRLSVPDAVALAHGLAARARDYPGGPFPSLDRVAICGNRVVLLHGVATSPAADAVQWVGGLLDRLLSHVQNEAEEDLPVGLRMIVIRATGHKFGDPDTVIPTGAFPRLTTLADLLQALARFASDDPAVLVGSLYERALAKLSIERDVVGLPDAGLTTFAQEHDDLDRLITFDCDPPIQLTFADLRPRREAAGVSLEEISHATKIPVALLDALERGDMSRWPRGVIASAHLTAYAEHAGIPSDALMNLALAEARRRTAKGPVVLPSPNWPLRSSTRVRERSRLAPFLLIVGAMGLFVLAGPALRSLRPRADAGAPGTLAISPDVQRRDGLADGRSTLPISPAQPPSTPSPAPGTSEASAAPIVPPPTASGAPTRPTAPTETPEALATSGSGTSEMTPPLQKPRDPTPPVILALRTERERVVAALGDNEKALARAQEEQHEIEVLLHAAQSDEDAAAFKKRLDELTDRVDSLTTARERLQEGLRVLDQRLRPRGE